MRHDISVSQRLRLGLIDDALRLCNEFRERALGARQAIDAGGEYFGGQYSAAMKRASMDLTRSLARLRGGKP